MKSQLPSKKLPLASVEADVVQALDGCHRKVKRLAFYLFREIIAGGIEGKANRERRRTNQGRSAPELARRGL